MPRASRYSDDIRQTADAQLGLITSRQLAELGVRTSTVHGRVVGGMSTRVLPGVHLVDGGHPARRQRELAALLYAGAPSMLTGLTALRRYGLRAVRLQETVDDEPDRPEPVHVLIPHERRRLSTGFARIERTHRFPDVAVRRGGLWLAAAPRAVGDAARRMRRASDVAALVSEVVQRDMASVDDLVRELREGSRRGSSLFRAALGPVLGGARSGPESELLRLLEGAGVRHMHANATLVDARGGFVAVCDVWLDDVGLAIEVDSIEYHAGHEGFESTVRRNTRYARAGVVVVPVLPAQLRSHPAQVLRDIVRARDAAAARPRPAVYIDHEARTSSGREGWRWGA